MFPDDPLGRSFRGVRDQLQEVRSDIPQRLPQTSPRVFCLTRTSIGAVCSTLICSASLCLKMAHRLHSPVQSNRRGLAAIAMMTAVASISRERARRLGYARRDAS